MAKKKKTADPVEETKDQKALIAKKDWHIISGSWDRATGKQQFDIRIKAGDDVSALPAWALKALEHEKVI